MPRRTTASSASRRAAAVVGVMPEGFAFPALGEKVNEEGSALTPIPALRARPAVAFTAAMKHLFEIPRDVGAHVGGEHACQDPAGETRGAR
ncbi:MAG: hypothetical protein H0W08_28215 [Acidobacteria bacterium]|nr:hypothetical protein [Acidobacteriota bacterium]